MPSVISQVLPKSIKGLLAQQGEALWRDLEEIRIREGRPLEVVSGSGSRFLNARGQAVTRAADAYLTTREECRKMLNLISNHSLYALEEELRRGYVTVEGGHRIGLSGRVVVEGGRVKHLREVTGFNIRIARQVKGVGTGLIQWIADHRQVENLLIISPPQCGKTTLLRDLARIVSEGARNIPPRKVGVVDERSEIAGCIDGVPQHDVGPRTDVMDACPKAEGMMMMIRSMSPEVLVVDEIGRREDADAVHEALYAGVNLFTTAHGRSLEEVCRRPTLSRLVREGVFTRFVVLSRRQGPGTVEGVYDGSMIRLDNKKGVYGA